MTSISRLGLIIPSLGTRPDYLIKAIKSARSFANVFIVIVVPQELIKNWDPQNAGDLLLGENEPGIGGAINWGMKHLPNDIELVGWLGDDDLLAADAGRKSAEFLRQNQEYVMTFGKCRYVGKDGESIGMNTSGQWAVPLLRFGPDLIPQPGSIFRRTTFNAIGRIDSSLKLAFDLDLFIRLSKAGKIKYMGYEVASFRWHSDSKSVASRRISVLEASRVRRSHLPNLLKLISPFWEINVALLTYMAGVLVSRRAKGLVK